MNNKVKGVVTALLLAFVLILPGCSGDKETATESTKPQNLTAVEVAGMPQYPDEATASAEEITGDTYITLAEDNIVVEGEGATAQGSILTITQPGKYVVTGTLTQGQIVVEETSETENVKIILNGVNLQCPTAGGIYVKNADKVVIETASGSVNLLTAGETVEEDEANAAIYSKDDLKIEGEGALYITAETNKGIHGKDDVEIESGNLYITSGDDGIRGKDSVTVTGGNIVIAAQGDGIRSDNDTEEAKGYIDINGGHLEITAAQDGIQAFTTLSLTDGEVYVATGGGAGEGATHQESQPQGGFTREQELQMDQEEDTTQSDAEESTSFKGLKAGSAITIEGGALVADCADDALHTNGDITVNGGSLDIATGDDGIHADVTLTINDGVIAVSQSYEGLEAKDITINNGTIDVVSSDDGINGAEAGTTATFTPHGGGGNCTLTITQGNITVNAQGDGIDVNGNTVIEGGEIIVYGPSNGGNGGLDYDGTFDVNGGTLVVFGAREMALGISATSEQPSLFVGLTGKADTSLKVTDESDSIIIEDTCPKEYGCVVISTPDLTTGTSYNFYLDGENLGAFEAQ